jgi:2-C-methyl-D-erythritol 4-phosphate cytidylyltransferase
MRTTVIISGGGAGTRFGDELPKQFHLLPRRSTRQPVMIYTAKQFESHPAVTDIVLSVPSEYIAQTKRLVRRFRLKKVIGVVAGGQSRRDSVRNALWSIAQNPPGAVLIHDAVRPFIPGSLIDRVVERLNRNNAVVPVIEPRDTVRRKGKRQLLGRLEDRHCLLMIQTPQGFRWDVIMRVLPKWNQNTSATDDASIVIENGIKVAYVEGSSYNFKITTPEDMVIARAIARNWYGEGVGAGVERRRYRT